jgi:hypothetical protein
MDNVKGARFTAWAAVLLTAVLCAVTTRWADLDQEQRLWLGNFSAILDLFAAIVGRAIFHEVKGIGPVLLGCVVLIVSLVVGTILLGWWGIAFGFWMLAIYMFNAAGDA